METFLLKKYSVKTKMTSAQFILKAALVETCFSRILLFLTDISCHISTLTFAANMY